MKKTLLSVSLLAGITLQLSAQDMTYSGGRGSYFSKKIYSGGDLPVFPESRKLLPEPVLSANPGYIRLYWKAWELAFAHFKRPPAGSPFVSNFIDEAFSPAVFQWDTFFMVEFARYGHAVFPAINSLDNFYCRQWDDGFIHREIQEKDGMEFWFEGPQHGVNPPLFAWAEVESWKLTGDNSRFKQVYPVLIKHAEWLEKNRKATLSFHHLYWNTGLGSGMDNTPRGGSGWVDMSAQMVMVYNSLAVIADATGKPDEAEAHRKKASEIGEAMNRWMWNEQDGLYYDVDNDGHQIKHQTIACFWPMLAGICSKSQVEKLLGNLKNPHTFWRTNVFPSLAANHPDFKADGQYWQGGVWAPTNVMVMKGLDRYAGVYNTTEFGVLATERYLDNLLEVYQKTGTIWETYSSEAALRGSWSQPDFVGWSGCGPIQLLIENCLGFRPDGAGRKLVWYVNRIDEHGIKNLTFGGITASVIASSRPDVNSGFTVTATASEAFSLTLHFNEQNARHWKPVTLEIRKGTGTYPVVLLPE
ncbi:MAG: hypothetical protein L6Q77_02680 [Bacteroidetes bacterium]|nr:hypothetical protein [Bacteroidota bacterium]